MTKILPRSTWLVALGVCLALAGCTKEKKIEVQQIKIGAGGGEPVVSAPAATPAVAAAPNGLASDSGKKSSTTSRKKKKDVPDLEPSDDGELPPSHSRFGVLPESSPGGVPFEVGVTTDADRFAFVPGDPQHDSTKFAYSRGSAPGGMEGVGLIRDDSRTQYELPEGFTAIASAGNSVSGLPWRIRCDTDGAVMALVPEGIFVQGSNSADENAAPEHGVLLDAYYIDMREVTAARYDTYREAVSEKRRVPKPARSPRDPQEPVMGVTWAEAHAFALWAGKELPTEAQWEKAARGTDGFKFPWGNGTFVWDRPREPGQIDVVGSFRGDFSPCGAYDMAGNAREWCTDWYSEKYYEQLVADAGSTARNPTGPKNSAGTNKRVVKGGDPNWLVCARDGIVQSEHPTDVGFRCVLKLKPSGAPAGGKGKKGK
ncbi:MAG: formylglycine-generating enzyme family protein [Planctomycetia bacterium]|nr:formylglycine-generating enzyme family protein [Planctomycetia bacterium]